MLCPHTSAKPNTTTAISVSSKHHSNEIVAMVPSFRLKEEAPYRCGASPYSGNELGRSENGQL
jgi:hypothetical protein